MNKEKVKRANIIQQMEIEKYLSEVLVWSGTNNPAVSRRYDDHDPENAMVQYRKGNSDVSVGKKFGVSSYSVRHVRVMMFGRTRQTTTRDSEEGVPLWANEIFTRLSDHNARLNAQLIRILRCEDRLAGQEKRSASIEKRLDALEGSEKIVPITRDNEDEIPIPVEPINAVEDDELLDPEIKQYRAYLKYDLDWANINGPGRGFTNLDTMRQFCARIGGHYGQTVDDLKQKDIAILGALRSTFKEAIRNGNLNAQLSALAARNRDQHTKAV